MSGPRLLEPREAALGVFKNNMATNPRNIASEMHAHMYVTCSNGGPRNQTCSCELLFNNMRVCSAHLSGTSTWQD